MQTTNSDGKVLSNSFESAITASSQFVKPKVVVDFQDSRHLTNVVVSTNSDYSSQFPSSFSSVDGKTVSILSTSGANTFAADGYLSLPGVNSNYAKVEDSADLDILGVEGTHFLSVTNAGSSNYAYTSFGNDGLDATIDDLELVFRVRVNSITAAVDNTLVTRGYAGQFFVSIRATNLYLSTTIAGIRTDRALTYSIPLGTTVWLKITRSWASGDIYAYYAADQSLEPTSWTQIGTLGTPTGTTPSGHLTASTNVDLTIGAGCDADFYRVIVRSAIDSVASTVYDADFTKVAIGATTFNESSAYSSSVAFAGLATKIVDGSTFLTLNGLSGSYASVPDNAAYDILGTEGTHYLSLPGVATNYASTPNLTAYIPSGPIEVVVRVAAADWSVASEKNYLSVYGAGGQRGWRWFTISGTQSFGVTTDGTTLYDVQCSVSQSSVLTNGVAYWLKATFVPNNGSSGTTTNFYYAADQATEPTSWTQMGTTRITAGVAPIFASNQALEIGSRTGGGLNLNGRMYRAIVRNGIGGTAVFDANFTVASIGASSFVATSLQTVTINGSIAKIVDGTTHLQLPGIAGNYASMPSNAGVEISGDIEIVVRVALPDWTPATTATLVAKRNDGLGITGNAYSLRVNASGQFLFDTRNPDNLTTNIATITPATALTDGATYWVRVTRSGVLVSLYVVADQQLEPTSWGTAATTATPAVGIFSNSAAIEIGSRNLGGNDFTNGRFYRVIIRSGVGGTVGMDADFTQQVQFATSFIEQSANAGTVAIVGAGARLERIRNLEIVARVEASSWRPTAINMIVNKGEFSSSSQISYLLYINLTDGKLRLGWSSTGNTATSNRDTASQNAIPVPSSGALWLKATLNVDNGAGGYTVSFWYAPDQTMEPTSSWVSLGTPTTVANFTSIYPSNVPVQFGEQDSTHVFPFSGRIYQVLVRNGIGSAYPVLHADFTRQVQFSTSFREMSPYQGVIAVGGTGARVERLRDIEIVFRIALDTYGTHVNNRRVFVKGSPSISYFVILTTDARLQLWCNHDGATATDYTYLSGPVLDAGFVGGQTYWFRLTRSSTSGTVQYAPDQPYEPVGSQWITMTPTIFTGAAAISRFNSPFPSTAPFAIGAFGDGVTNGASGKYYNVIIRNGIGGTPVLNVNFAAADQFQNFNYYFSKDQVVNGVDYETFAWGVAGALDNYGKVITADGTYSAVPADLSDNYKYGWWSASKSSGAGTFATPPTLTLNFTATTVNKIKVVTSSMFGQVKTFTIDVYSVSSGLVLSRTYTYDTANYEFEKFINLNTTYSDIHQIIIGVTATKNALDYARFVAVSPLYQVDISEYVMNVSSNRVRDLHETSLPIAGTSQTSSDITLDNSNKIFSLMNTSSQFGKFLQKDLRVYVYNGWKVSTVSSEFIQTFLTSTLAASGATSMAVGSGGDFPNGDIGVTNLESNYYVVTVDKGNNLEEKILVKKKTSGAQLDIQQRGYAETEAVAHAANASVVYDTFEYVNVGTFYIEDISSTTNGMDVNISLNDRFKFLNDKILDKGFFRLDSTVPDALRDLMFVGNFPRNKFKSLGRFSDSAGAKGSILQLKCDDESRNGWGLYPYQGVRVRLYQLPSGFESNIKDLQIDAYEKQMSDLDKALGLTGSITPSYVTNFSSASLGSSFGSAFTRKGYFNGVMDGYYIPISTNAICEIGISFNYGGVRLYVDDNLVIDSWNSFTSAQYVSGVYNFTAGIAYKIRLEFFHTYGMEFGSYAGFPLVLSTGAARVVIGSSELLTSIVSDDIGSRDASLAVGVAGRNSNRNSGIPSPYVSFRNPSAIDWNTLDSSIVLSNTLSTGAVNSFVRVPYHASWNASLSSSYPSTDWSIEVLMKSPSGALGGSGEYISNWSNGSSTTGFEFFYISSTNHGFRIKSAAGTTITATSSIAMPDVTGWNHVIATYNTFTNTVYYYVNGILNASAVVTASTPVWGTNDLTFGGRGAGFTSGTGVVKPTSSVSADGINLHIDEFNIYARTLSSSNVLDRYKESKIKEVRKFAFLFGFNESVFQTMQNISFADLGRVYIDESENVVYEHFYAYFEPTIDQHANVQQSFADSNFIIDADIKKTLQVNSVVVKVSGTSSSLIETQPIWRAPSPTTLGVLTLMANIDAVANTVVASSFDIVPFPKAGYIVVDKEIMKYSGITQTAFTGVERGVLNSTASAHIAGAKVREVKWFNFEYDKHPVLSVKSPFITGILFEDPDQINVFTWQASPFKANLVIAASDTVDANTVVFAEGTDPLTKKVSYLSIAGIPVQVVENKTQIQEQKAVNSENRRKFGLKEVVIESPFINDVSQAQELASFIISKLSEPIPIMSMNTVLTPKVQVGDRIRISSLDQFDIVNSDFWVSAINISMGSGYTQQVELRKVV